MAAGTEITVYDSQDRPAGRHPFSYEVDMR
jgi:hypothetical protein